MITEAAMMPGSDSGRVMRKNRRSGPSPRSVAASRSDRSIFCSDTKIGRIAKGAQACDSVTTTAFTL